MNTITDYITIAAFIYLFFNGWCKGFLRTLLGPFSLVVGCAAGFFYYQKTQNIALSLGISVLGPFMIAILGSILIKLWHKSVDCAAPLSLPSKICASAISILWGGSYLVMTLIFIAMAPLHFEWFEKIQDDVLASKSYHLINQKVGDKMPDNLLDVKKLASLLQDPAKLEELQSTEEFQALQTDERLQNILSDEDTAEQIKSKNYTALMTNPKIQEVFQDKDLLEKIMAVNRKIAEELPEELPEENPGPRIIEIEP